MTTKLTLSLSPEVIAKAKEYAKLQNRSVSRIVESYLETLVNDQKTSADITPFVKGLSSRIEVPEDSKNELREHLIQKHS